MKHLLRTTALSLSFAAFCGIAQLHAAPMNKCVVNGRVSYQQTPCSSTQARKDPTLDELNAAEKQRRASPSASTSPALPLTSASPRELPPTQPKAAASYRCDGRKYCSQMSSCAEAKYFLSHCPGVKMDGDNDGIPCEEQWCSP